MSPRRGVTKSKPFETASPSIEADVIGRTGVLVRARGRGVVGLDVAVDDRVIVDTGFEVIGADVIGRPSADVVELRLLGDVEPGVPRIKLRLGPSVLRRPRRSA